MPHLVLARTHDHHATIDIAKAQSRRGFRTFSPEAKAPVGVMRLWLPCRLGPRCNIGSRQSDTCESDEIPVYQESKQQSRPAPTRTRSYTLLHFCVDGCFYSWAPPSGVRLCQVGLYHRHGSAEKGIAEHVTALMTADVLKATHK